MARATPVIDKGHRFGGAWTEIKLDAVHYYLQFYTQALSAKPSPEHPFELWYIDAFAGSGSRRIDRITGGLFDGEPLEEKTIDLAGSVLRALDVQPPFKRLIFIEQHRDRFRRLEEIAAENPHRNITKFHSEANDKLVEIFGAPPWSEQRDGRGSHRAIVFLDPFGMSVRWKTLMQLAETGSVDVWYLFPTGAVNRQLAGNFARVDPDKQRALDEVFGSDSWREDIYKVETARELFDERVTTTNKTFTVNDIERYAQDRLKTIFSYVSDPLPLLNQRESKMFSLFCLANSSSQKALNLIRKGVKSVQKKYGGR